MDHNLRRRREFLETCIVRGGLIAAAPMLPDRLLALWESGLGAARKPTPHEVLGPFFKKGAPNKTNLRIPGDPGLPLRIRGAVLNTKGEPVPGASLDIWHADSRGVYDVRGYRYRAKLQIGAEPHYTVETILPGHYPDRPAQHVHYLIQAPGHKPLITQLYFATDPFFEGDPDKNYAKRGVVGHRELIRPVTLLDESTAPRAEVVFDIILEKA